MWDARSTSKEIADGAPEIAALPKGNAIVKTAVRQPNYDYPDLGAIWV